MLTFTQVNKFNWAVQLQDAYFYPSTLRTSQIRSDENTPQIVRRANLPKLLCISINKQDIPKCYVDPITGTKFYSKNEVSRYLKTVQLGSSTSKHKKRGIDMHSAGKVEYESSDHSSKHKVVDLVVEKSTADGLPPGWIKEVKVKKVAHKTRRDPYYTDPVSGYIFRSKRDVLRYLQTGEIGRHANKPKKRINGVESTDDNISPSTGAKRPRMAGSATRRRLFTGQGSKLSEVAEDEQIMESSVTEDCVPLSNHTSDQCGKSNDLSGLALPEAKGSKKTKGTRDCAENRFESATATEVRSEKQPKRLTRLSLSKSKDKKEHKLPCRASKRLAGIKVEEALDMETGYRARRVAAKQSGEVRENPEELKTEKKDDEKADFPFGDSWSDPCLEFAFKTLTGAIPVEDNLAIQDYFQKQLSTSQTPKDNGLALPDFGLDSFCQTDSLVQFDAPENPQSVQQLPVNPTFPPPGNVGLPSSAQNVL
ncbi:hypothetical protein HHK36_000256 [Tetracentron sinense]|uniref:MBD domain-containing protein n=1 Tax=Tetracentron sinense TaxID=13715 RepID=A0A834ZRM5_TETSI|nr:hypothetical protein HHK36_000256 [Tetracentron sinense]